MDGQSRSLTTVVGGHERACVTRLVTGCAVIQLFIIPIPLEPRQGEERRGRPSARILPCLEGGKSLAPGVTEVLAVIMDLGDLRGIEPSAHMAACCFNPLARPTGLRRSFVSRKKEDPDSRSEF